MSKSYTYSASFDKKTEKLFREGTYLGQGNNGIVFELPGKKAVKIFLRESVCRSEGDILKRTQKSKYFPNIYVHGKLYVVRDMVYGVRLDKYIKRNGLSRDMSRKIYNLLKEFKKLGFTRLDTRCKDVYVTKKLELRMIDPKGCYTRNVDFPRHLMKKFNNLGILNEFLKHISEFDKEKANYWKERLDEYFEENNLEYL